MNNTSMQDIANQLGISRTLVHLALTNKYGVNEATRSLIITTALNMGYDFNRIKSKHTNKKTKIALFLMQGDLKSNTFWNEIVCAIEQRCNQLNLNLTIKIWNEDNVEDQVYSSIFDDQTEGVITLNHFPVNIIVQCRQLKIPVVLIDNSKYFGSEYNHVRVNNYAGGFSAAKYLYSLGHRKIFFVGFTNYAYSLKERFRGFKDFVSLHDDIESIYITEKPHDVMKLYDSETFLENYKIFEPTAIMCINDAVAKYVYTDFKNQNLQIGTDVSVMTFDCSIETEYLLPKITGVYFDKLQLGIEAVNLLNESIKNYSDDTKTILLPTKILENNSVKNILI